MRRVSRIDRNDECRVEKQSNVGVDPAPTQIARAEYTAIATWVVRPRARCQREQEASKPQDHVMFSSSLCQRPRRSQFWERRGAARRTPEFNQQPAITSWFSRSFSWRERGLGHSSAVQRYPRILGDRIFVCITERLVRSD